MGFHWKLMTGLVVGLMFGGKRKEAFLDPVTALQCMLDAIVDPLFADLASPR